MNIYDVSNMPIAVFDKAAPKISAIVSAYYCEDWLFARLDNLLEQPEQPEVIVVCQIDSAEHAEALKYPVKIITTDGIPTIYQAWNIGISAATGEYLTNANSDDRHYAGGLSVLMDVLETNPGIGLAYGDLDIYEDYAAHPVSRFRFMDYEKDGGFDKLLQGCFIGPAPMWRRSLHDKYGMFDPSYHVAGDYEYWLRLASQGVKFRKVNQVLGAYLARADSAERRETLRTKWETSRARGKYRK